MNPGAGKQSAVDRTPLCRSIQHWTSPHERQSFAGSSDQVLSQERGRIGTLRHIWLLCIPSISKILSQTCYTACDGLFMTTHPFIHPSIHPFINPSWAGMVNGAWHWDKNSRTSWHLALVADKFHQKGGEQIWFYHLWLWGPSLTFTSEFVFLTQLWFWNMPKFSFIH